MMEVFASALTPPDALLIVIRDARPPWSDAYRRRVEPTATRRASTIPPAALDELRRVLSDGQWHSSRSLAPIARRYNTSLQNLTTAATWTLPFCESDDGKWLALLTDRLPVDEPRFRRWRAAG